MSYDFSQTPSAPIVELTLSSPDSGKNIRITALVDSGADATVLPLQFLQQISAQYLKTTYLRTGDERRILVNLYRVSIELAAHTIHSVRAVAIKNTNQAVVGRDVT